MNNFQFNSIDIFKISKNKFKDNLSLFFFTLLLITIPLNHLVNSFLLVLFFISSLFNIKLNDFKFNSTIILLIIFYFLMVFSWFWTIDKSLTLKSLIKEIPLLIIPICFILNKDIFTLNKDKILKYYTYSIVFLSFFFLLKAFYNFFLNKDLNVFFFHSLVTKELNAVHFSVFVSLAFFYFLTKEFKKITHYFLALFLLAFLFLLSSKNIIFSTIFLSVIYFFYFSKSANKMRLRNMIILLVLFLSVISFNLVKERLIFEFKTKEESNIGHTVINKKDVGSNVISMKEAWYNLKFNQTDYFSGSSFRVYQTRLFFEFLKEENIFWTGFGLNASYEKIEKKGVYYNVFQGTDKIEGYKKKNFHNQYIQTFAELGIIGFMLLILILFINLKNAIKHKDFIHIAFAVLMISLFLTESFLWRQRGVVFFTAFYCVFNNIKKE
jgi:O-antigen ligase